MTTISLNEQKQSIQKQTGDYSDDTLAQMSVFAHTLQSIKSMVRASALIVSVVCFSLAILPSLAANSALNSLKGVRISVPLSELPKNDKTVNEIKRKLDAVPDKSYDQGLNQREQLLRKYRQTITSQENRQNFKLPDLPHADGKTDSEINKKRRLYSVGNQIPEINEGNQYLVTDNNYIYYLESQKLFVYIVNGTQTTLIYSTAYDYTLSARELHAGNGFLGVIFQGYDYNNTRIVIKVYENNGIALSQVRSYEKEGYFVESREYNQFLMVVSQTEMTSPSLDYKWTVSGVGQVDDLVYQGVSANSASNNTGQVARFVAKIPLSSSTQYRFATYILCDYTYDIFVSSSLGIYIAGSNYNYPNYKTVIQYMLFNEVAGQSWGASRWIVLPGLIINSYQMHEYNGYFRAVLIYTGTTSDTYYQVSISKIPVPSFDPTQGQTWNNVGEEGLYFSAVRWRGDVAYMLYHENTIIIFSTSLGFRTDWITTEEYIYFLYPYGDSHMIGFGSGPESSTIAVVMYRVASYSLIKQKALTVAASANAGYSYSYYGWYNSQNLLLDWNSRRFVFPIYTSEDQPWRTGHYQLYINPTADCMSSLPVPADCSSNADTVEPVIGKLVKHWDEAPGYSYDNASGYEITRATLVHQGVHDILVTTAPCQVRLQVQKPANEAPAIKPTAGNVDEVRVVDTCL